jgi:transcriptional regulator with XRE-family HTH domain
MELTIGERIALKRNRAGLKQKEVAARAGCSLPGLIDLEADRLSPERIERIIEEMAAERGAEPALIAA